MGRFFGGVLTQKKNLQISDVLGLASLWMVLSNSLYNWVMRKNTTSGNTANFEVIDINLIARVFLSFTMMGREVPVVILITLVKILHLIL